MQTLSAILVPSSVGPDESNMKRMLFGTESVFIIILMLCFIETTLTKSSQSKQGWIDVLCNSFSITAARHRTNALIVNVSFSDSCGTVPPSAFPVRFFFTLNYDHDGSKRTSSVYMQPMYCSCKDVKCTKRYGNLKLDRSDYVLSIDSRCSGYGIGINACNVCVPIQLILPRKESTAVSIFEGKYVETTPTSLGRRSEVINWVIIVAIAGPATLIVLLTLLLVLLCSKVQTPPRKQSIPLQNGDIFEDMPLKRKRVLVIAYSESNIGKSEAFFKVLRKFDDLNIINIEEHIGDMQDNYHNWVQNEVLRCDVAILVLSRDLNEIVSCDHELIDEYFSNDILAPVIYELVNFCQAVNVTKHVITFDRDLDYLGNFLARYPSFNTGAIFDLSNLKQDMNIDFSRTVPDLFHLLSEIYRDIIPEKLEADGYISQTLETESEDERSIHTDV